MEGTVEVPALQAPTTQASVVAPAPISQPTTEANASGEGVFETVTKSPLDLKSVLLISLLAAMAIYSILASKKILEEQENERVKAEEFDAIGEEIDELKMNLKKAMGSKYVTVKK
jgi:hypothetical protein